MDYKPQKVIAVDSVQARLDLATELGAETWNFKTDRDSLEKRVKELTGGRGADAVIGTRAPYLIVTRLFTDDQSYIEVVGLSPALRMAFELLRPWGESCR